jgi:o-succinylbenzoate---CoA ligase
LGDAQIAVTSNDTLKVRGTVTAGDWIETTDLVEIISSDQFSWIGRADHIVNTGGVKVNPEMVEQKLQSQLSVPYIISGLADEKLGQKLILILESATLPSDFKISFESLDKYHVPKEIFTLPTFVYTETGKINRIETVKLLLK